MIDPARLDLGLEGKVALVTGAARNIGRATALALSAAGVKVGLVAREQSERLEEARAACASNNPAHAVAVDIGDPDALAAGAAEIESELGPVDILINNAAIRPRTALGDVTLEEWDRVMAVNVRAPFLLIQRLLPGMQERRWGRIINVSGMDAYWGSVHRVHVTTSKLAVAGLTAALTAQVAKYGITVNTVVPGAIDTERHSPGWYPDLTELYDNQYERVAAARFGSPEEMANVMLFVASQMSSYMTGQTFHVSGGYPVVRHRENELDPEVNWVGSPVSDFEKGRYPAR
jgi:3-oxoacyl-[acyl-carrier protein] reductase